MRVHLDLGTVTFNNMEETADLRKREFTVGPLPIRKTKEITMETVNNLLPWNTTRCSGSTADFQESILEKLKGFKIYETKCHEAGPKTSELLAWKLLKIPYVKLRT